MSTLTKPLPWWGRWLMLLAVALCAFSAGAFLKPAEVVETHSVEIKWKEKISKADHTAKVKTRIVYVDRVILPDGTVKEKSETRESESALTDSKTLIDRSGESKEIQSKTTISKPDWRVGVLVGAAAKPEFVITGPLVLGVHAERRIIGGVWLGAWVLPNLPAAGGSLTWEFPK